MSFFYINILMLVVVGGLALQPEDVDRERWMTELRPWIGDQRLGDIILPASHDAGTSGIDEDSHLIDRNFLFRLGDLVTPDVLVNWSKTQDLELEEQLQIGFRVFDLRIADCEVFNDTFRWWHGLAGDHIFPGLQQIYDFAVENPEEVIVLEFGHFSAPSDSGTQPIPEHRRDEIAEILLEYLEPVLVPKGEFDNNPTMNELLSTGHNVVAIVKNSYMEGKSDLFWPDTIHNQWSGRTNPEALFAERSAKMKLYKENYSDRMTKISGCATPDETTIAAAMMRVYGDQPIIKEILELLLPGVAALNPDLMSFEGVYLDLVNQARYGTNTGGMFVRPAANYTNGASMQYMPVNEMWEHWIGRSEVYKSNIITVDDTGSSAAVDVAIRANMGEIGRQTSLSFNGNTRDGFYEWDTYQTVGGADGLDCIDVDIRYSIEESGKIIHQQELNMGEKWTLVLGEGDYSSSARVVVEVETSDGEWEQLYEAVIQDNIDDSVDVYVRGSGTQDGGFTYVSHQYDLFGEDCETSPEDGYFFMLEW